MRFRFTWPVIAALTLSATAAQADGAADDAAVRSHITCYAFGIDKIGRGDQEGGLAIWKDCFSTDLRFSAFVGRGAPTNCPGSDCPFPKDMTPIEMRAAFAKRAFDSGGFVKTSHHLTNVSVSFTGSDRAIVNAYVQAWHWKADNTVVVAPGTWDAELARIDGKWLITRETLAVIGVAVIAAPSASATTSPLQPRP
jgi:SnoaL-like domain